MASVIDTLSVEVRFNIDAKDLELFAQCIDELDKVLKGGFASIKVSQPDFEQKAEYLEAKIAHLEAQLDELYEEEECPCPLCMPFFVSPEGIVYINGACL